MAEIAGDEAPAPPPPAPSTSCEVSGFQSTSNPASTGSSKRPSRTTKPGVKRLVLTASVLLSFLLGLPILLKSTEIHRSPLPSDAITALAHRLHSNPPSFPCGLHAVFLRSGSGPSDASLASRLERAISAQLQLLPAPSTAGNVSVSVTVESAGGCSSSSSSVGSGWQCGAVTTADLVRGDEVFDELLHSALGSSDGDGSRVYTVVVVEIDGAEGMRVVIGKHRHAWVLGKVDEAKAVSVIGKIFVKYFMNGGIEEGEAGIGKGEFMPVGSDGNVVLSFSLLNADPSDWVYDWEFEKIGEKMLNPVIEALRPIAEINIESQVLYHTPKSSYSYSNDKLGGNVLSMGDIPFFVNSNEWHLDTSISATGRSKVLQFVVYVPSAKECPLYLQLPDGGLSKTNAFISPMWGGVFIRNPPDCSLGSKKTHGTRKKMSSQELMETLEIFIGQLRQLFGLKPSYLSQDMDMPTKFVVSEKGFTEWELDLLCRHHACSNLLSCLTTLESLSSLVHSLPRMIVMDEIGRQVELSLEAANLAQRNASLGIISATRARALAEDAFFHPSIMSISYASIEHYFAIYMPFFAPVSLHVLLAAIKELKRYKAERAKYSAFLASRATSS
ncbi:GPI transamidase component PIG-S [Dichanthelium oligosanthes]|uniref:GPI transamidase component PIG-S n=1 Tax=Dichanthelium oligosanthes TaxID=888268 RepID=A0A1E5WJT7_9POAL|nr:GPI transamidase component PIG-S [Dichanthelium oligosanthes]